MRAIAEPFFEASGTMLGPVAALLLFVAMFAAVLVFVFLVRDTEIERVGRLALDRDQADAAPNTEVPS